MPNFYRTQHQREYVRVRTGKGRAKKGEKVSEGGIAEEGNMVWKGE